MEEVEKGAVGTEVCEVEQTPLFNIREHGTYLNDPRLKRLRHKNVVEQIIHFWSQRMSFNIMLARL